MTKVVINGCCGGFSLSHEGCMEYLRLAGKKVWVEPYKKCASLGNQYWLVAPEDRQPDKGWSEMSDTERSAYNKRHREETFYSRDLKRDDPLLAQVVENLGKAANGRYADLEIVEVPDDVEWDIQEYDGNEWVAEKHRTWS